MIKHVHSVYLFQILIFLGHASYEDPRYIFGILEIGEESRQKREGLICDLGYI
jgi:hypothetical protein